MAVKRSKTILLILLSSLLLISFLTACSDDKKKKTSDKQQSEQVQANDQQTANDELVAGTVASSDETVVDDKQGQNTESTENNSTQETVSVDANNANYMKGLYQYMADAPLFTDCATGQRYPVALEGDNIALEQAYLALITQPGQKMLVELEGEYDERAAMEGDDVYHLIPTKFIGIIHKDSCN
ncbi:MAG: hypothetical protein HWD86_10355 [Kangiellaceae bacterium]|nr:hypothetical protein [Kangiellaceae bacterium]